MFHSLNVERLNNQLLVFWRPQLCSERRVTFTSCLQEKNVQTLIQMSHMVSGIPGRSPHQPKSIPGPQIKIIRLASVGRCRSPMLF